MKNMLISAISSLSVILIALVAISNASQAWALTGENAYSQTILASDEIKNNPLAMKILQNIEISKLRMNGQQDQKFIEAQKKIANEYLQRALAQLNDANSRQQPIIFMPSSSDTGNQARSIVDDKKQNNSEESNQKISNKQRQFESHSISGVDLQNNPLTQKILNEIEYSKQQIAQYQKDKKDLELIKRQKQVAKNLEERALRSLQMQAEVNSSKNSFDRFVSTVQNSNAKNVFVVEFGLMQARLDAGHVAMKRTLDNGGTWEDAVKEFSKYAGVKRVEMIQTNRNLNVQYGLSDQTVQAAFDERGLLPDDYIKVPKVVSSH